MIWKSNIENDDKMIQTLPHLDKRRTQQAFHASCYDHWEQRYCNSFLIPNYNYFAQGKFHAGMRFMPARVHFGPTNSLLLMLIRNAHLTAFIIREPAWSYRWKAHQMARDVSRIEVQNCGMAFQLSPSRHPLCIVLRKLFKNKDFFFLCQNFGFIVNCFWTL